MHDKCLSELHRIVSSLNTLPCYIRVIAEQKSSRSGLREQLVALNPMGNGGYL